MANVCSSSESKDGIIQCCDLFAADSLLMVPNYAPATAIRQVKVKVPRSVAEKMAKKESMLDGKEKEASSSSQSSSAELWDPLSSSSSTSSGSSGAGEGTAASATTSGDRDSPSSSSGVSLKSSGAAALASPDDLVEVEHAFPVGVDQHPLLAALHRLQREKAASNAALGLSIPSELLLLTTFHLASEMLWRAVLLVAAASWMTDLLYASGLDDWLYLQGGDLHAAVPQVRQGLMSPLCAPPPPLWPS